LAEIYRLPMAHIEPALSTFRGAHGATNPLALAIVEQAERMRAPWERATVFRALFRAALAVAWGGDEQLSTLPDPWGDSPFTYRPLPGGFELESQYQMLVFDGVTRTRMPARLRVWPSTEGGNAGKSGEGK